MKAKPIFTIGIPCKDYQPSTDLKEIREKLQKDFPDYHILTYYTMTIEEPKFECFYEKDFNEVKFEELKQIVKDNFK